MYKWALDIKSERMIPYELVGFQSSLPSSFAYNDNLVNWQGLTKETAFACVFFGEANSINEIRYKQGIKGIVKWEIIANYAELKGRLDRKVWALLIDWPKCSLELQYIDGYAQCETIQDVKQALVNQWPVWVWSNQINRTKTSKSPYIVVAWDSYWHKFVIVWYDDNKSVFICENSYWPNKFDNWRFYLKYENFNLLFYTKTVNFINEDRIKRVNLYIRMCKTMKHKEFYEKYYITELNKDEKMLKQLAMQIVYIWKVNTESLKELLP